MPSFFKKLFKKDKGVVLSKKTETQTNVTINQIQDTSDLLTKRRNLLQRKMDEEQEKAKALLVKKDKKGIYKQ